MSTSQPPAVPAAAPGRPAGRSPRRPVRAHQEVWIPLGVDTVEQGVAAIRTLAPRPGWGVGSLGAPRLRVRDDGRVRAGRWTDNSVHFPTFAGRVETDERGRVQLHGLVRESLHHVLGCFSTATVVLIMASFVLSLVVGGITGGHWNWPAIAVGVVASLVFALLHASYRRRRRRFPHDARMLVRLVAALVPR